MPTREAYGVAGLALLIFLVAYNLQAGWVYAVDALLVGLLVAGALSTRLSVRGISLTRRLPREVGEGEVVPLTMVLEARGIAPRFFVQVHDAVPGLAPVTVAAPLVRPGHAVPVPYQTVALRRGVHRAAEATLHSGGLTGLFAARRAEPAAGEIIVHPRFWMIRRLGLLGSSFLPDTQGSVRRRGGEEFHSLRDYRPGDSLRHIHWRSSARRGAPVIREFEQEGPGSITLLIDSRAEVQGGAGSESTFEDLIRVAASVAWFITTQGATVRILTARGSTVVDAAGGWKPTIRRLAEILSDGALAPVQLLAAGALEGDAQVILLTPEAQAIAQLGGQGRIAAGVLADVSSYPPAESPGRGGAARFAVPVCVIRKGEDIGAALEET